MVHPYEYLVGFIRSVTSRIIIVGPQVFNHYPCVVEKRSYSSLSFYKCTRMAPFSSPSCVFPIIVIFYVLTPSQFLICLITFNDRVWPTFDIGRNL